MLQMIHKIIMSKTNVFIAQSLCVSVCVCVCLCVSVCVCVCIHCELQWCVFVFVTWDMGCVRSCEGTMSSCQSNLLFVLMKQPLGCYTTIIMCDYLNVLVWV